MALAVYREALRGFVADGQRLAARREEFTFVGNLDNTNTVYLRRVWSMAIYRETYAGMLPSGRVRCIEAGRMATHDQALAPGWCHMVAVREGQNLKLYVNGRLVATSSAFNPADYDLSNNQPLRIGFGICANFRGAMRDLRIYNQALTPQQVSSRK